MKQFAINFCTLFIGLCGWAYYTGILLVLALLFVWCVFCPTDHLRRTWPG